MIRLGIRAAIVGILRTYLSLYDFVLPNEPTVTATFNFASGLHAIPSDAHDSFKRITRRIF